MARTKQKIENETEKTEVDAIGLPGETPSNGGILENVGSTESKTGSNRPTETETETEILKNLSAYSEEPTNVAPIKKERKKRQTKVDPNQPQQPQQIVIPGRLFVTIVDRVGVGVIGLGDQYINKNPLPPEYIKILNLTDQQKDDLAPLGEACVKAMNLQNDPISAFFISYGAILFTNYMTLRQMHEREIKSKNVR